MFKIAWIQYQKFQKLLVKRRSSDFWINSKFKIELTAFLLEDLSTHDFDLYPKNNSIRLLIADI